MGLRSSYFSHAGANRPDGALRERDCRWLSESAGTMRANFRIEVLLFVAVWWTTAAFNSGGGWNQNARFAQVRAMVEERRFAIDHFLIYATKGGLEGGRELRRIPVEVNRGGAPVVMLPGSPDPKARLAWRNGNGKLTPIVMPRFPGQTTAGGDRLLALGAVACTGDVAFANRHFYPNKPPGASLAAVPAYAVLFTLDRLVGWNRDRWWVLTVNAWLTTVFSVGLASALGAVILFRLGRSLDSSASSRASVALSMAVAYAFGTMALPYGTMLFDQNVTAVALLGAFALLLKARRSRQEESESGWRFEPVVFFAGLCAGGAVVCNYIAGVALLLLALYAGRRRWGVFALGAAGPLALLAYYQSVCFGSPFSLATTFQNPMFGSSDSGPLLLGMFRMPKPEIALMLLFSPFRGLFVFSPVLVFGVLGLWQWCHGSARREAWLCTSIFLLFFTVNALFIGWHGGYGVAPRYLGPAVPFLALGLVAVWHSLPRLCTAAACVSAAMQFVLTATDPLSPVGTGSVARDGRPDWLYSALTDYSVPLLVSGRAWPLLDSMSVQYVRQEQRELAARGVDPAQHAPEIDWLRGALHHAVDQGEPFPFPLAAFSGPVSVNPTGICEGDFFQVFGSHSLQAHWNAFNVGEFLWPKSLWSLAPILAVSGLLLVVAWRFT